MVLRRTGLDDLPLLVVLGLSAGLLIWAGTGRDGQHDLQAGSGAARAERESGAAPAIDRLASASDRASSYVSGVRLGLRVVDPARGAAARKDADAAAETLSLPEADVERSLLPGVPRFEGPLRAEGEMLDGVPRGPWVLYDAEGRPVFRGAFSESGQPLGQWLWTEPDGRVLCEGSFEQGVPDGLWREWHANGQLAAEMTFDLGDLEGAATEWYDNGASRQQGGFDQGDRAGLWSSWYDNGQLRARGAYDRGLRTGLWEEWHPDGKPMLVATYVRGRAHGLWQSWYSNGQPKERGHFIDGRREGVWHFFDFAGNVDLRSGFYREGRMVRD